VDELEQVFVNPQEGAVYRDVSRAERTPRLH
jgi:hypothetical protein